MRAVFKPFLLGGIAFLSTGYAPAPSFSPAALAILDPTAQARSLCGGDDGRARLTRQLQLAALAAGPVGQGAAAIPLFPDLAGHPFPLTTSSDQARRYFSQGLLLTYGFSHAGAVRSFREAQRLDPDCALCWWGEAAALGPNINAPMDERDQETALAALDKARALRGKASPMEAALIDALGRRYSRDPQAQRAALDVAYADAMLDVARRFPADNDVAVLAAEAVMDTTPWNYWQADKKTPVGRIGEAVRLIEGVVARDPSHLQASHLYIHLMENGADARLAEAAADRLARSRVTSAGHLVHMPGHIYQAIGRYSDSIRVNIAAARADEAFIKSVGDQGLVRFGYYPHNVHFIVTSAQMAGDVRTATREAARLRRVLDAETAQKFGWVQAIDAARYFTAAQFADPRAILAMPAPDARLPYPAAMRHYARAVAQAQRRDRAGFEAEMAAMAALRSSGVFQPLVDQGMPAVDLVTLAEASARGRWAFASGQYDEAATHYRKAIALEAKLPYQEPSYWYYPASQSLGAALYQAGRYEEAAQAFREALALTPGNGWALYGLARSEQALGRTVEAAAARQAFRRAWAGNRNWLKMERL